MVSPFLYLLIVLMWVNKVRCFHPPTIPSSFSFFRSFTFSSPPCSSPGKRLFASTLDKVSQPSEKEEDKSPFPKITLKRNRQSRSFRDGSQLVFSGSILNSPKSLRMADLVLVQVPDSNDSTNQNHQQIGIGVYNPSSMYRVRILSHSLLNKSLKLDKMEPKKALEEILSRSFEKSLCIRRAMGFPSSETDTFRLINGEGDGISGLAVDIVGGDVAVVMSSAAWCQVHKSTIVECLHAVLPNHYELIWKTTPSRLRQDGYTIKEEEEEDPDSSTNVAPVIATENDIKYKTWPHQKGQKTSVYCDQRENRLNFAKQCQGKRVLDLCCYHGGFSLNAAKHGAAQVTGVDSSQEAIDTCVENAKLNNFDDCIDFVKSDISNYMKSCNSKYDAIVLDPPKLAPSMASLNKASKKYLSLNRDALKLMSDEGGLFMTCTCSSAMTQKDGGNFFLQTIHQASLAAKREVTLLRVSGAAPCHTQSPISFPAGNYLTAAIFYVHGTD